MMLLRRISGVLLLLIGTMGVIACVVAIYHTGSIQKQFRHFVGQVSDTTEDALADIRHRLDQIDASLASVRADLKTVVSSADMLGTDGNGEGVPDHIAFALDHGVKEQLVNAQQLVDSVEDTAGAVSHLLTLLDGRGPDSGKDSGRDGSLMTRIKGASGTLGRLPGMLEQARQTARDLQQNPNSEEIRLTLTREVGRMDKGLAEVQALGLVFGKTIQGIEDNCRYYQKKTLQYLNLGGILIPLLLVLLGAGQAALIILGGHLCIRREN
jgi:TM2 domain-containing membrane protein YozV